MLSSSTLFHYTKSRQTLLSILTNEFQPNFCLERAPFDENGASLHNGTPMVCFCDIPLSAAAEHMAKYGKYAIGLSKEWGISHGVSPVLYTHAESPISVGLRRLLTESLSLGSAPHSPAVRDEVMRIMAFTKPYEGESPQKQHSETQRFYDEREWRWVPQDAPEAVKNGIDISAFVDGKPPEAETKLLQDQCKLGFDPKDIRYIVVATEDEIYQTVRDILRIKHRYTEPDKTVLTTRVVSAERIRADF